MKSLLKGLGLGSGPTGGDTVERSRSAEARALLERMHAAALPEDRRALLQEFADMTDTAASPQLGPLQLTSKGDSLLHLCFFALSLSTSVFSLATLDPGLHSNCVRFFPLRWYRFILIPLHWCVL